MKRAFIAVMIITLIAMLYIFTSPLFQGRGSNQQGGGKMETFNALMKLYELNGRYHDTKEKMAWLATTFYAGFSLAVIKGVTTENIALFLYNHLIATLAALVLLVFIASCVLFFCRFQYKKKRASQKIDVNIRQELSSYTKDDQIDRLL